MRRKYPVLPKVVPFAPFKTWNDLALRTAEMLVASAQVIGHRTARMARAGPSPNARDRREFTRMGTEKIAAASESALAMGKHLATMNSQASVRAWQDWAAASTAWAALATSLTLPQALERQAALVGHLARTAQSAARASQAAAHLGRRGLAPVHARATANARRLGRKP